VPKSLCEINTVEEAAQAVKMQYDIEEPEQQHDQLDV
jgi:hypothetical protein